MADYVSQFTGAEIDSRLRKAGTAVQPADLESKQDTLVSGENIKTVNGQSIVGSGNIQIQAGDTDAVKYVEQTLTDAQKEQARTNIAAASAAELGQIVTDLTGIEADIDSLEAAVQAIGVGDFVTATALPTASASTMGHIYLIGPDANNNYDRYFTQESGGAYSWVPLGSTQIDLSTYATQEEVSQLRQEVHNLSGKYYGIFESANDLPEGDANGYAFVGVEEPFLIYNCVNGVWSNTQAIANCFIGTTIDDVSININNQVGTPSGAASIIGKTLNIDLYNLKGDKGDDGEQGVPGPQGPEGPQGNSGYQGAAGELEIVNNLSDGGGTKALSAEMGKQLNIVKPGISEGTTGDLEVADENGNAIVIFKDGGIQTKNFDSEKSLSTNLPSVPDNDLEIKDENNFAIVIFKNGGIKTKNFDSSEITNEISSKLSTYHYYATRPKVLLFDYGFATEISPDFATNSNWSISGGKLVSSSAGIGNRLQNNLHITVSQKRTYCRFAIGADTYFAIGWLSSAFAYDGSIFSVNASDGVFAIHANWTTAGTLPSVLLSKSYAFVSGREYEIVIEKDGHINRMWIVDCLTGATSDVLETQQTATSGNGEFVGGRQMDRLMIIHISGISPQISYVRSVSKYKEPLAVVYGDSITEGDRVYNGQTYVDHLKNLYGDERIMCSGLSGSVISNVIDRMNAELPLLKPKFVIVAIGTNGRNTQQLFNNAKQVILDNGAIPIFCVPPMGFSGLDDVRGYILNLNVTTVRFDIATAINNDIAQGKNTSLFADTYHPNANGHLAMYRRLLADCQILNNY